MLIWKHIVAPHAHNPVTGNQKPDATNPNEQNTAFCENSDWTKSPTDQNADYQRPLIHIYLRQLICPSGTIAINIIHYGTWLK